MSKGRFFSAVVSFSLHQQALKVRTNLLKILHIVDDAQNKDTDQDTGYYKPQS